jgi:hypothetical protein
MSEKDGADEVPAIVSKALSARPGCALQVAHAHARRVVNGEGQEQQRRSYYIACPATATAPPSRELVYVETRERTLPPGAGLFEEVFDRGIFGALREALRDVRGEPPAGRKGPPPGESGVRV